MYVPVYIVEQLKCGMYLSRGPVYLQRDGAAACGQCFSPERPATRNEQYETAAKLLQFRFPCKNQNLDCRETVPFADEAQDVAHEAVCEYRQCACPVLGSSRCNWLGPRTQILQHCRAQHPDHVAETCAECGLFVPVKLYRTGAGWRCERCAPAKRACRNRAQRYFCQQSTRCYICREDTPRGTLPSHYASAHVTHSAGATWRTTAAGQCLVTCPAGTAVCDYWLLNSGLHLEFYFPVPSERLCEFRCEVRVTQPDTGLTRIYTPDVIYMYGWDWFICVRRDDFHDWNCEFDVGINICNI